MEDRRPGNNGIGRIVLWIFVAVLGGCFVFCCLIPIQPLKGDRIVLEYNLKAIAEVVNSYRKQHAALPQSLNGIPLTEEPYLEGYTLIVAPDGSFLVVSKHRSFDEEMPGARCHFACDEKLQIKKLSESDFQERRKGR